MSGQSITDHVDATIKMMPTGKGAQRQNADPNKPIVALGQSYFAVQTRRQELADALEMDTLANLTEDQKRLFVRRQLAEQNTQLATAAREAGVITPDAFGTFQDPGYRGLYAHLQG